MSARFFRRFSSFKKNPESVLALDGDQNKNDNLGTEVVTNSSANLENSSEPKPADAEPKPATIIKLRSRFPKPKPNIQKCLRRTDLEKETSEKSSRSQIDIDHDKGQGKTAEIINVADHTVIGSPKRSERKTCSSPKSKSLLESNLGKVHSPKPDSIEEICDKKLHTNVSAENKEETVYKSVKELNADTIGSQAKDNTDCVEECEISSEIMNPDPPPNSSSIKRPRSRFPKPKPNFQKCDRRLGSSITEKKDGKYTQEKFDHKHVSDKNEVREMTDGIHLTEQCKISQKEKSVTQTVPVQESRLSNTVSHFKKSSFRNAEMSCTNSPDVKKRVHFQIDEEKNKEDEAQNEILVSSDPENLTENLVEKHKTFPDDSNLSVIVPGSSVIRTRACFFKPKPNLTKCDTKLDTNLCEDNFKGTHEENDNKESKQRKKAEEFDVPTDVSKLISEPEISQVKVQGATVQESSQIRTISRRFPKPKPNFRIGERRLGNRESARGGESKNEEKAIQNRNDKEGEQREKAEEFAVSTDVSKLISEAEISSQVKEQVATVQESSQIRTMSRRFPKPKPNFRISERRLGNRESAGGGENKNEEKAIQNRNDKDDSKHNAGKVESIASGNAMEKVALVEECELSSENREESDPVPESDLSQVTHVQSPKHNLGLCDKKEHSSSSEDNKQNVAHIQHDKEGKQKEKAGEFDVSTDVAKLMLEPEVSSQVKQQGDTVVQESSRMRTISKRFPKPKPNLKISERRLGNRESTRGECTNKEEKAIHNQNEKQAHTSSNKESTGKNDGSDSVENSDKSVVSPEVGAPKRKYASKREIASGLPRRRKRAALDHETFTMHDLIYWNPTDNPLRPSSSGTPGEDNQNDGVVPEREENRTHDVDGVPEKDADKEKEGESGDNGDAVMPGPRVTIGPNGEITIDESSLVVHRTPSTEVLSATTLCLEEGNTTYTSFRSKQNSRGWTDVETKKFYKALSTVGTDFTLMSQLFPDRNRRELKLKFKREEKNNRCLVDGALGSPPVFNLAEFHDASESNKSSGDITKKKNMKKCKKRNKQKDTTTNDEATIDCDSPPKKRKRRTRTSQKVYLLSSSEEETVSEEQVKISQTNVKLRKHKPRADLSPHVTEDEGTTIIKLLLGNNSPAGESEHNELLQGAVLIPLEGQSTSTSATFQESNNSNNSENKEKETDIACEKSVNSVQSQCKENSNMEKLLCSNNGCGQQPKCLASPVTLAKAPSLNAESNTNEMLDNMHAPCAEVTQDLENSVTSIETQAVTTQNKDLPGLLSSPFVSQAPSSPKTPVPHKFLFLPKHGPNNEQIVHVFLVSDVDKPDVEQGTHKGTAKQNVTKCSDIDENNEHIVSKSDLSHVQKTCDNNTEQHCMSQTKETGENKIENLSSKENDPPLDKVNSVLVTPNAEASCS